MEILYNANIHTLDSISPTATALAIDKDRILAVGNDQQILSEFESRAGSQNMEGRPIIPGLTDAHIHLQHYALSLDRVDCETTTRAECLQRVAERAQHTPPGEWILGHGWNHNEWGAGFGTAADLDAVAPNHPVYLTAKSLHAGWANSLALRATGINPASTDPPGGALQRDAHGAPTGILLEGAMELVANAIPEPTLPQVTLALKNAQERLWQLGLTSAHDFDRQKCFTALQVLHEHGELGLRITKSVPLEDLDHAIALGLRTGFGDDYLRIGSIKAFTDGALGPRTAAMLQPFEGEPENRGMLLLDAEQLFEHGRRAVQNGLSLAVHAIGDRANHEVLDALTQLRAVESQSSPEKSPLRHRIEHVQIIHPDDHSRLVEAGIIASMQPIHATSDYVMADHFWGDRTANAYAWRTMLETNTPLAFGSDAPVESPNPFWGLHAAVTRQRQDGSPGAQGWHPEQRLTIVEALHGFTTGAAYAAGMEDRLGMLSPGYLADLLVLDADPFTCQPEILKDIRPLGTMIGGKWVFREK
jgi:predicted amidohydrolase YtcJ